VNTVELSDLEDDSKIDELLLMQAESSEKEFKEDEYEVSQMPPLGPEMKGLSLGQDFDDLDLDDLDLLDIPFPQLKLQKSSM
jgi:hypothetical protein